ncbi:hypothetical protein JST97_32130 [bacterium]|nr:hypothetical protein [bacterium]
METTLKLRNHLALIALLVASSLPAAAQNTATQTLTLTINPGALSITGGGTTSTFSPLAAPTLTTGQNALTLTNPPTFVINDARGTNAGWSVALTTATNSSPSGTTVANQHLFYNVGNGGPTLTNLNTFTGSFEGTQGGGGLGDGTGVTAGTQDTNANPVKTISAASTAAGNAGSRNYRIGNAWALQDVSGGGSIPLAGAYNWTMTATLSATP